RLLRRRRRRRRRRLGRHRRDAQQAEEDPRERAPPGWAGRRQGAPHSCQAAVPRRIVRPQQKSVRIVLDPMSKGRLPMLRITLTSIAVLVAVALALGPLADAQQAAPPSWKQGQPANMADSTLAPIAQPPAPKAAGEIPVDK